MDTAERRRDNRLGLVVMANARRDVPVEPISTASLRAKYIVADDRHALVLHTTGYETDRGVKKTFRFPGSSWPGWLEFSPQNLSTADIAPVFATQDHGAGGISCTDSQLVVQNPTPTPGGSCTPPSGPQPDGKDRLSAILADAIW